MIPDYLAGFPDAGCGAESRDVRDSDCSALGAMARPVLKRDVDPGENWNSRRCLIANRKDR
jgi:hypothetical protein